MRYIFGKWESDNKQLEVNDVIEICAEAETKRKTLAAYPLDKIFVLLEKVRQKWIDENNEIRQIAQKNLPQETGFSPEMIKIGLDAMGTVLDPLLLRKKIKTELRGIPKLGEWKYCASTNTALAWHPIGAILHILSGNVFLVALGSLVEGLITGNVNIFKMSGGETVFLPLLIKSLIESDDDGVVSKSISCVNYSSSQEDVIAAFKKGVDGIVVWGGEDAVKAYRNNLTAKTKLIVFGPKLSFSIVTQKGIAALGLPRISQKLAEEISIWDQNACTAPQICFVEGESEARNTAIALSKSLEDHAKTLPSGEISIDAACEIRKMRTVFEIAQARNESLLFESSKGLDWTVIVEKDLSIEPSPLHRTIKIVPYHGMEEILTQMENMRGYIQTVGVCASQKEQLVISKYLAQNGALRVVSLGQMAGGEIDDPHDGSYDLPQFVNIVFNRMPDADEEFEPIDYMRNGDRAAVINERLRHLILHAKKSVFYNKRLHGIKIESCDDLEKIPVLTRDEMEENMSPRGNGLCTGDYSGGYVSRSGGTTGEPKFSIYDGADWDSMIGNAVRVLRGAGIKRGDRLANCFIAGDLYGSFVSFDHINYRIGVTTFAFGSDVKPDVFLDTWRKFKINVIQGVPTIIIPMLRMVKNIEPAFTIEKVLYAGSPMSRTDLTWLHEELKTKRVASVIGANDGGQIAFQCAHMEGKLHHAIDDFNYIEIVDDSGKRVPIEEPGKIVITSLLKFAFPLIRYEIGDEGRIVSGECRCGRTIRTLEYLGRADDVVSIGLLNIYHRNFKNAIQELPVSELQIVAKSYGGKEEVILKIESENSGDQLRAKIYDTLISKDLKLKDRLNKGVLKMEIECYKPGEIPRNPRTGKLKAIIDERIS